MKKGSCSCLRMLQDGIQRGDQPMLTGRADRKRARKKLLCALLAALLLTCIGACAETAEGPDLDLINPDLILAQDTVDYLELTAPEGGRLTVRSDPSVPGRGEADPEGNEPDYSGVLGFAALPNDPEIGSSSIFCTPSWQVPVYRRSKDGKTMVKGGSLAHKTPVLVIRQKLKEDGKGGYTGWLQIVRLDTREICYIKASCFATLPYWQLPIAEIPTFGYCLAIYRESPGTAPRDATGQSRTFRDGEKVLIPCSGAFPMQSPDPKNLTVQGIVFTGNESGSAAPEILYFRETDLTVLY